MANTANSKVSTSKRHTLGNSEARQTRWQSFDKCVATPGQMTTCQFYVYRTELQVPFTITRWNVTLYSEAFILWNYLYHLRKKQNYTDLFLYLWALNVGAMVVLLLASIKESTISMEEPPSAIKICGKSLFQCPITMIVNFQNHFLIYNFFHTLRRMILCKNMII